MKKCLLFITKGIMAYNSSLINYKQIEINNTTNCMFESLRILTTINCSSKKKNKHP